MACTVIVNLSVKPEHAESYVEYMKTVLPDTRAFEGCEQINIHRESEDATQFVIIELWQSKEQYTAYLNWRKSTGAFDKMPEILSEPMKITYLDRVD